MTLDAPRDFLADVSVRKVTWFSPKRPVDNGTVFVKPEGGWNEGVEAAAAISGPDSVRGER